MRLMSSILASILLAAATGASAGTLVDTYASTVNNVAILPDNGCADDTNGTGLGGISNVITIPAGDGGEIVDLNVQIQSTHTWRSDIQATLSDGTNTVRLANNHDGSGDNYFAIFDSQGAELCSAAANCGTAGNCAAAPGPICQPDQSLDIFNGAEAADRTFTLNICDRAAGDLGTLNSWAIEVERQPPTTVVSGTYPSTVNNVPILPDNGCVDDTNGTGLGGIINEITIPAGDTGQILDIDLQVQISQTWRSDIQASLSDGTNTVILANNHDGSGDNYFATFDSQSAELCSAAANCGTAGNCTVAPGPICQPNQSLDVFNGAEAAGRTFTLSVCDRAAGDLGNLLNWTLLVDREGAVVADADLSITKTNGTVTSTPGTDTVYTITASNAGPADAPGSIVVDTFPAACSSVDWTCIGAGGGSCTAAGSGNINDTVDLPSGASVTYTATCAIDSAATGTLANTATITPDAAVTDPDGTNNSATDTDTLGASADVSVTKVATTVPVPLLVGSDIVYQLTASNAGPSTATGVVVTDSLPAELDFASNDCGATFADPTLTWNVGTLAPSASAVCNLTTTVADTGQISNTATITAATADPVASNDSATSTLTGAEFTDMAIALSANAPGGLGVGDGFIYTVTGTNNGPGVAFDIGFSLTLAGSVDYISNNCGAVPSGNVVNWTVASLPSGASTDCEITVLVTLPGDIPATAEVDSSTFDPDLGNNSADLTLSAVVVPIPALSQMGLLLLVMLSLIIGLVAIRRG